MTPSLLLEIVASAICLIAFGTATRRHFRVDGPVNPGMRLVLVANVVSYALFVDVIAAGGVSPLWPGSLALMLASLALFGWAIRTTRRLPPTLAFDDDVPVMLHRGGPYARIRHPFYTAYLGFWVATSLATSTAWFALVPVVMIALYVAAALLEERKFESSGLAAEYRRYRAATGMFLPRLRAPAA